MVKRALSCCLQDIYVAGASLQAGKVVTCGLACCLRQDPANLQRQLEIQWVRYRSLWVSIW